MAVLERVAWLWTNVSDWLCLPGATSDVIDRESISDVERLRAVLRYWLQHDPHASWRMLIWRLDHSDLPDLKKVVDDIRSYAEILTGQWDF